MDTDNDAVWSLSEIDAVRLQRVLILVVIIRLFLVPLVKWVTFLLVIPTAVLLILNAL